MGHIILLCLALVAGNYAVPIQERITTTIDTCAAQCTASSKFNYEPGTTYEFEYDTEIRTSLQGAAEDYSGVQMSAIVHMEFTSKCEMIMRLSDITMTEHDPETSFKKDTTSELKALLEKNPIRVSYQDGNIEQLCLTAPEPIEVTNIKRGILSVFQNNMDDVSKSKSQTVSEADVTGNCDAEYTSGEKGWYNMVIKKSKNLLGCTGRQGAQTSIQGIPYTAQSTVQSLPIVKSSHDCEQDININSGRMNSATCREQHTFVPFSRDASGAITHSTQKLTFKRESSAISNPTPIVARVPLIFQHAYDADRASKNRKDLERNLMDICESTKSGVRPETPRLFTNLVYTLKTMEAAEMAVVYQKVMAGSICSENQERVKKFFLDAIPMTGTVDSLKMMTQLLISKEISGIEADMWLTTLAFIQLPTIDMISEVKPLLSLVDNEEKALLSVSSLVHSYCKINTGCDGNLQIRKIISLLESKIGSSCKVTDDNFKSVLFALRAIGNAGYGTSAITTLSKCISQPTNPIEIRLSAIEAFRRIPCTADKRPVLDVFINTEEDSEVRIAAYKAIMECPTNEILSRVRVALSKEEVNQVGSYVWSHLTNMMETSDPHKQAIRAILEDEVLQKEFDLDKRKFSRNYEGSLFLEKINTGAKAEGDLIWSSKSFIPRSGMFNLTVDLFGNAINLLEIGGRVEGLEYFLESYFGPNGYFSENDVEAAEETALKTIKPDKVSRIEKRMKTAMDELRGSLYMRVFGNELRYMNFKGVESLISKRSVNFIDILMKLSKDNDYTFSQSSMFMDSSIIIPTSAGFPMNLTVNGTATLDLKASGKMDVMKLAANPPSLDINGIIQPSAAIEISTMMSVDAFVTKTGIKMVSNLHTNTMLKGKIQLSEGRVLNAKWDLPEDRMDIISVKSSFFTIHRDTEREQKMITDNRQAMASCTGDNLAYITGLQLCGELQFPNASLVNSAPYFPLTGPVSMTVSLNKKDTLTGYKFEARSTHDADNNIIRFAFSTPNSKIDRSFGIDLNLNKVAGTFDASITSPWKRGDFKGTVINERSSKGLTGRLNLDGSLRAAVKAAISSEKSGPGMVYTPTIEITTPAGKDINIGGSLNFAPWKMFDVDLALKGATKSPITLKGTMMKNSKMARASATLSLAKDKDYTFETNVQMQTWKKKVIYKPTISIRTPTRELLAIGGGFTNIFGKKMIVDFVMDKVFSQPLVLKGAVGKRDYRRNRQLFNVKMDMRSSPMDVKLKSKFDNRNWGTIATDIDLTYVIKKIARNNIKLVSKLINLSSKTLTKAKATVNLAVKQNPELNLKFSGNVNNNDKRSEIDADISYGPDFKDDDKQISLSASMNRNIKSLTYASASFNGNFMMGKDLRIVAKADHRHDKRSLDSSVMLRLNKDALESTLKLSDKSKDLTDMSGEFTLNYPGKKIAATQTITESGDHQFNSSLSLRVGKSTNSIMTSWKRSSPTALMIGTSINLQNIELVDVKAEYSLGPNTYIGKGFLTAGTKTYGASFLADLQSDSLQVSADIVTPSRKIAASADGTKSGDKYTSRVDIRLDAEKDDTNRIVLTGTGNFPSKNDIEGSMTLQYPGRTLALNVKNVAQGKLISHVDFQWESGMVISFDTSFGDVTKRDMREITGDFKLRTPFQQMRMLDISLNQQIEALQYVTKMDFEWNPKQILSTTLTLRRPMTLSSFSAELLAKTPIAAMKTVQVTLSNRLDDRLSSSLAAKWNKQSAQADISFSKTDDAINGQIDIKTSFRDFSNGGVSFNYLNNLNKQTAEVKFMKNKVTYSLTSEMTHDAVGYNVRNFGNLKVNIPDEIFSTVWDHSNTMNDKTSTGTITFKDNRVSIKYSGHQDMGMSASNIRSVLEIQSTFAPIRDIMVNVNHEHKTGLIDSNVKVIKDGTVIASADAHYTRDNGKVTSIFRMTTPFIENDLSAKVDLSYLKYPMTGRAELSLSPELTAVLDGSLMRSGRDIDSSVQLKFPYLKPINLKFAKSMEGGDLRTSGSVEYIPGQQISFETRYRNDNIKKLQFEVTPPSSAPISLDLELQGSMQTFRAEGKITAKPFFDTWSAVGSWDSRDGLSASLKISMPYKNISYVLISAESSENNNERQGVISIEYKPEKEIKLISVYSLKNPNDLKMNMKLTTPFAVFPFSSAAFSHKGNLKNFSNHVEIEYQAGKRLSAESSFSSINGLTGSARVTSPFSTDIMGSFSHSGDINNFKSHAEATWGTVSSIYLQHESNSNSFKSNMEVEIGRDKYEGEIKVESNPKYSAEVSVKTPIKSFESTRIAQTFEGTIKQFTSHSEIFNAYTGKYSMDVRMNLEKPMSGEISILTPVKEYKNMRTAFSHDSSFILDGNFASHIEVELNGKEISGDMKLNTNPILSFETSVKTPYQNYKLSRFLYTHEGSLSDFKCHGELQRNKDISEADLSVKAANKIDIDFGLRSPYMDTLKVSLDHWGSLKKFTTNIRAKQGKLRGTASIKFQVRPTFSTMISLKTPFSYLKNQQLTLKHAGDLNNFKCDMQYRCNGKTYIGDASFDNSQSLKGEFNFKGPNFKPVGVLLTHTGPLRNFQTNGEVSYGKSKMQVDASLNTMNDLSGKLSIISPFDAFESMTLIISHSGPISNFKSHGEVAIDNKNGQIDISFSSANNIEGSVSIKTPFKGMETISASVNHIGDLENFNTIAKYSLNKKTVESRFGFANAPVITGSASVRSSFPYLDNYEASFRHETGDGKFKTHGEMALAGQRHEGDVEFNSKNGYSGSVAVNSPRIKDTEVSFKHSLTDKTLDSNAHISYGGSKTFNIVVYGSVDQAVSANLKIETPFEGFENTEMSAYHDGPVNNFRCHGEINFRDERSEADVEFSALSGVSGKVSLKSPAMENIDAAFSYDRTGSSLKTSAEASYGYKSTKGTLSLRYSPDISGDLSIESPITKPLEIRMEHTGPVTNCRTTAEYQYGGEPKFNWDSSFRMQSADFGGDLIVKMTVPGYRRFGGSVQHAGYLSNFRTTGNIFCEDSVHKGEISFSPEEGKLSIDSPVTKPINIQYSVDGDLSSFKSEGKVDFGNDRLVDISGNRNSNSGDLMMSIKGLKTFRLVFTNRGTLSKFISHGEMSYGSKTAQADVSFNSVNAFQGSVSVSLPNVVPVSVSFNYNGKPMNFQSHGEVALGSDKHEADISFSMLENLEGEFSAISPLLRPVSVSFRTTMDLRDIDSNAKLQYDNVKLMDVSATWTLEPVTASVTIITPTNSVKSIFNFNGQMANFQSDAAVTVNGQTTRIDVALNIVNEFDGKFELSSPSIDPASVGFDCDSRKSSYRCSANVGFQSKKHTAEVNLSMDSLKEAIVSLESPYLGSYSGKAAFEGNTNRLRSSAEIKLNSKLTTLEVTSSINPGDIDVQVSASSPFKGFESNNAGFTLSYSGNVTNFKTSSLFTFNKEKLEMNLNYNIDSALEGSLSIKTPFTKEMNIAFDKTGNTVTGSVLYGSETFFSTEGSLSKTPVQGSLKVEMPFTPYKTMNIAFSHEGSLLKSNNHAEIMVNDKKAEVDMAFNIGSKLEGGISLKSPFTEDMSSGFDFSGTTANFKSHIEMQYGPERFIADTTLKVGNDVDGEISITTPFKEYRSIIGKLTYSGEFPFINSKVLLTANRRNLAVLGIQLSNTNKLSGSATLQSVITSNIEFSFNHQGDMMNFVSDAEVRYNGQSNTGSISFKASPAVEGAISVSLPSFFVDDMSTNFKYDGSLGDFRLNMEGRLGRKVVSTEVTFTNLKQIALSANVKTPFAGYEEMSARLSLQERYGGYDAHADLDLGAAQNSAMDTSYTWSKQSLKGSIMVKTPYSMLRHIEADMSHTGTLPKINSGLTLKYDNKDYKLDVDIEELTPSNGKITITTPFMGYENTLLQYNNQGQFPNIYADGKLICASGREISGTVQSSLNGNKLETKATLITPYFEDLEFELLHNGPMTNFNNILSLSMGAENSISTSTSMKADSSAFNFDTTVSSTFAGYSDQQKVTASFDGPLENFKASASAKLLGNEISVDSSIQSRPSVEWKLSIKTPVENFRDVQLSLEHSGNQRRFSSKAEVQYATGKKIEGSVSYSAYGWRRLQTSVDVRTPFLGYERNSASYIHSASVDNLECNADMTILNKDFSGTLKAAKSPKSASLILRTPYENFDQLSANVKLDPEAAEVSVTYMKDKTITLTSEAKLDNSPKSASVKLTTPFDGFESSELTIEQAGDLRNFQVSATLEAPIVNTLKLQANLQSSTLAAMSGSVSFNSEIDNLENLNLNFRNRAYQGRYNTRVEASWAPGQEVVLDNSFRINELGQSGTMTLTTPFEALRQLVVKTERQMSETKYQETSTVTYNNKIVCDYDIGVCIDNGFQLTTTVREPAPYALEILGRNDNSKYSSKTYVNWDTRRNDRSIRIEGDIDMNNANTYNIQYQCPTNNIKVTGTVGKSSSKMAVSLNSVQYGYEASYSGKDVKAKVMYPTRSIELFGASDSKTTEGYVAWDADRDQSKKIGMKAVIVPTSDSVKADISVMMPSIGKDVQLDSGMILGRGRLIFDGKTEFTYSQDSSKKIAFITRLEDISSSWSVKNYSFSVGISHPHSSVDIQMSSKVGKSDDKLTGSIDVEYQTIKRDVKSFKVNGELDKLRKSVSLNVDTPIKKISILGNGRMDSPYRMALENKYDNRRPLNTVLTLDPTKRSFDFQMNYDLDNPFNEFHINAKYVNSSAVAAEVFHVTSRVKVTDAIVALGLNTSHLLHSRIHWRPTAISDFKAYANKRSQNYNSRLTSFMDEISAAVTDEIDGKAKLIGEELFKELELVILRALEMYEINEYHVRDITDAVVRGIEKMRTEYDLASEKTIEVFDRIITRIEEQIKNIINTANHRINMVTGRLGETLTFISQENEKLYNHYAERLYNATQHPTVIDLRKKYGDYLDQLSSFNPNVYVTSMADQYTSAMYNARKMLNTRLAGLNPVIQHGNNAYKYWEIRDHAETVVMAIYDWILEEIEKELDKLTAAIIRLEKSSITVYDPAHGEIQMELHLPIPIKSLDTVPVVNFLPYVNKVKTYIPNMPSVSLQSSDLTTWIPPFSAEAKIEGDRVTTFDGLTYDLTGTCTYLLAKDFVDGNFSIALKRDPETSLIIMADKTSVELLPQGQVRVNNIEVTLPVKNRSVEISSDGGIIKVDGAGNFEVEFDSRRALYVVRLSGWYHGKTSGLFGSFDNEPSNDLMTSYGRPIDTPDRFTRTWDIGTARCR